MTSTPDRIAQLLQNGVDQKVYPGAVWAVGDADGTHHSGACGLLDPAKPDEPMRLDTIFDVASLTKILAVWSVIGTLWEDGTLTLDDKLATLIPDLTAYPLGEVTVHQLLTHTAGLPLRAQLKNLYGTDPAVIRTGVLHEALHRPPGQAVEYTDRAALILGYLAEHLTGQSLDHLATTRIWQPLAMTETRFGPLPADQTARCSPTEYDEDTDQHLKGTAHDFSARLLGGVCGIAGTFSTLPDLTRFVGYLLAPVHRETLAGFGPAWVEESFQIHTGNFASARGLFWHPAPSTDPADGIYVHYGFTGTALWVAPKQHRWAILLTNKLYYTRDRQPLTDVRNNFCELTFG
jgi:CubicO group peptidase (beta-lactamase class C family)